MFTPRTLATTARAVAASAVIGLTAIGLAPAATAQQEATPQCVDGMLDDCYTKAEMAEFLDVAIQLVEGYFDELDANGQPYAHPDNVFYIPSGKQTVTKCVEPDGKPAIADDTAYLYCPVDNNVYIGQESLWYFYSEIGAAAPIVGLAHEYGHALQDEVGIPAPRTNNDVIKREDQADCIAGAWTNYIDDEGALERVEDLTNIGVLLVTIGEMESSGQTHGTSSERVGSFLLGFAGGLEACNAFLPDHSLT